MSRPPLPPPLPTAQYLRHLDFITVDGEKLDVKAAYPIYSYSYRVEKNAEEWTTRVDYGPPPPPPPEGTPPRQ